MQSTLIIAARAAAVSLAAPTDPEIGLRTAVAACEAWILEPATWTDGLEGFPDRAKLAAPMEPQATIPEVALPPPEARQSMHSWRVPVGQGGYYVTTSDTTPVCHVVGGGPMDFQPGAASLILSPSFQTSWELVKQDLRGDMISSRFVNKKDRSFSIIISHASHAGARTDRAQVVATAVYEIAK